LLRRLGLHALVQVSRQRCRRKRRLIGIVERRRTTAGRDASRVQLRKQFVFVFQTPLAGPEREKKKNEKTNEIKKKNKFIRE